jgi:hypothetical protein
MKKETAKTLESALINILEKTIAGVEKGVEFLSSEIPDVIYQLLLWHGIKNFIYFLVAILCIAITAFIGKKIYNTIKADDFKWGENNDPSRGAWYVFFLTCVSIVPIAFFFNLINIEWIKIWVAPKVWIIEYTATLVKQGV